MIGSVFSLLRNPNNLSDLARQRSVTNQSVKCAFLEVTKFAGTDASELTERTAERGRTAPAEIVGGVSQRDVRVCDQLPRGFKACLLQKLTIARPNRGKPSLQCSDAGPHDFGGQLNVWISVPKVWSQQLLGGRGARRRLGRVDLSQIQLLTGDAYGSLGTIWPDACICSE